ncbi:MAG: GNAT family N-acetyltransferase [Pseudomonadota bacterium]
MSETDRLPSTARLMRAVDATWPPARMVTCGGWTLRAGGGGGKRVSAARGTGEIAEAEAGMAALDQPPLFALTPGEDALDKALAMRGYEMVDPVALYAQPVIELADGRDETAKVIRCAAPLRRIEEIWDRGGVGPARRAVMERASGPKQVLMARAGDRPAGCAFVACDDEIAMVHAVEVLPEYRKQGVGERLMRGAASFAADHGAAWLTLAVTEENLPANRLYQKLGMEVAGHYHYRAKPS